MNICPECEEEFTPKRSDSTYCSRKCYQREYMRDYSFRRRNRFRETFRKYKRILGCSVCSETEPVCIDFHHLDPSIKEARLAEWVSGDYSKDRFLKELEKCVPLCSNCHRKVHAGLIETQEGWQRGNAAAWKAVHDE